MSKRSLSPSYFGGSVLKLLYNVLQNPILIIKAPILTQILCSISSKFACHNLDATLASSACRCGGLTEN